MLEKPRRVSRTVRLRPARQLALLLYCFSLPWLALASSSPSTDSVAGLCPVWHVGDWWTVESQIFDQGEKRAGAGPGWLAKEAWDFFVVATNSIAGEPCYQVSVKPKEPNRCPYSFCYWFRSSDLLVMRRELHQPIASRTGRPASVPVVQVDYSNDEQMPFVPADFPSLPLTVPLFAGDMTKTYGAGLAPGKQSSPPRAARSFAASVTQTFHPNAKLAPEDAVASNRLRTAAPARGQTPSGVFVLAHSKETYERQSWSGDLPWHSYAEKWEQGSLVRKSWLSDRGRVTASSDAPQPGGGR
jgi:hypothetical protein